MDLRTAHDICHVSRQRGPQDATLDLADAAIAQERREEAADVERAGTPDAFLAAAYKLECASINLRAHARGMLSKEGAREAIEGARRALREMAVCL